MSILLRFQGSTLALPVSAIHMPKRTLKRPPVNTSQLTVGRRTGALAMKVGMLPYYDKWAVRHVITVLQLDQCQVIQVKTDEKEGYSALQLGVGEAKIKRVNQPLLGHYRSAARASGSTADALAVVPKRDLQEFRVTPDCLLPVGTRLRALHFVPGQLVDVVGTSKGKGFAGAMKRWNFGGGNASHGNSLSHRILGSTGMRQDPGKTFKGKKMAGRMGGERTTVQNLKVMKIDPLRDLLYVKGAVPGTKGGFVRVVDAVKGPFYPSPPPTPTFLLPETDPGYPKEPLHAPVTEKDFLLPVEPDDPY